MSGVLSLLREWLASAERLGARLPELAELLRAGSWPLALLAGVVGLALLVAGARAPRVVSAGGGAIIGWALGGLIAPAVAGWAPAWAACAGAAGVLGTLSALAPEVYPIAFGFALGALLGARVHVGGSPWIGGAACGALVAVVAVVLRRTVVALTAAVVGAVLVAAALLAGSVRLPALAVLAQRPVLLAALTALLSVSGTAFQLGRSGRGGPSRRDGPREPLQG
jgi:hypothetical protein